MLNTKPRQLGREGYIPSAGWGICGWLLASQHFLRRLARRQTIFYTGVTNLREELFDHFTVDIGEAKLAAHKTISEAGVIES